MAFEAILTIEDKTFKVITFNYSSGRTYDKFGRPTSQMFGTKIEMVLEHSPECILLHTWAYQNHEVKSGKITFMKRDNFQKQTEIRFSQGYIVNIASFFTNSGEQPMVERIIICANKYEYESQGNLSVHESEWPDSGA